MSTPISNLFTNFIKAGGSGLDAILDEAPRQHFGRLGTSGNLTTTVTEYSIFNKGVDSASPLNGLTRLANTYDVTAQMSSVSAGIKIKNNGTRMYVAETSPSRVLNQYNLSTPYDISTATYIGEIDINATVGSIVDFDISNDGTKLIVMNNSNVLYEFLLGTPWTISTVSYQSRSQSINSQDTQMRAMFVSNDGLRIISIGSTNNKIYQFTLGSAWNLTSITFNTDLSMSSYLTNPTSSGLRWVCRDDTGTRLVVLYDGSASSGPWLQEIKLSTDSTLSGATIGLTEQMGTNATPGCIHISSDYMYYVRSGTIIASAIKSNKKGMITDSVQLFFDTDGSGNNSILFSGFTTQNNNIKSRPMIDQSGVLKNFYSAGNVDGDSATLPLVLYSKTRLGIGILLSGTATFYSLNNLKYAVNYRMV